MSLAPWCQVRACEPLSAPAVLELTPAVVLRRVAECHPDVQAARRVLDGAAADVRTAAQGPNPQLTVGAANLSRELGSASRPLDQTYDHQLRIDQLIERGDKPALRLAAARAQHEASRADLTEVQRQAALSTLRSLHEWRAALARQAELATTARLYAESQAALQRRVTAGDAAALDLARFRLEALRLQADLAQAGLEVKAQRQQIALALAVPVSVPASTAADPIRLNPESALADDLPADVVAAVDRLAESSEAQVQQRLEQRGDVAAARARVSSAEAALALARALRTRDVSVGLQFDRYPTSARNPSGTGNTVSVFASVPLFLRHAYEGENAKAEADLQASLGALHKVLALAQADWQRARQQWQLARQRRTLVRQELLPTAERVAAGAELAYVRGASPVLDLLEARRALRAAHLERVAADLDAAKAAEELRAALAQGLDGGA